MHYASVHVLCIKDRWIMYIIVFTKGHSNAVESYRTASMKQHMYVIENMLEI